MAVKHVQLGFSSCPNDTFMFHGLVSGEVALKKLALTPVIEDIEALNLRAFDRSRSLDISKLSVAAWTKLQNRYSPLNVGAALGRRCGPLVVIGKKDCSRLEDLEQKKIAIPGNYTTANLLLRIFSGCRFVPVAMRFDEIMPAVAAGAVDAGVIIHESRFTYQNHGLRLLADLGERWEKTTQLPLPLGIIAVTADLEPPLQEEFTHGLRQSILQAQSNPDRSLRWIHQLAQEIDSDVCQKHIELYVNEFSIDLGAEGREAIATMVKMAHRVGFSS